ncbi:hypothetical protein DKX38_028691 [Salix brachista]|uniref:FLZ-type domain-containing protein n=1 Tax=Salix brachista TaxID=2182728 RepID=A0A5N5JB03_9ROSI|nr:hypothetical protein DKX38_028691 [Salix brachista]
MSQFGLKMERRRRRICLSLFTTLTETFSMASKSPRNFENGGGAVGLGIVAAMEESDKVSDFTLSPRSSPVPVVSLKKPASCFKEGSIGVLNFDKGGGGVFYEDDESYTCVISHVGNNVIKKSVYYDDKVCVDSVSWLDVGSGQLYAASPPVMMPMDVAAAERREFWRENFLSSCNLCKKLLEGLDIFMHSGLGGKSVFGLTLAVSVTAKLFSPLEAYKENNKNKKNAYGVLLVATGKPSCSSSVEVFQPGDDAYLSTIVIGLGIVGENAFCSPECRNKHIRTEDFKEKSGSEARKKQECSVTPCSSPLLFFAGVAAA